MHPSILCRYKIQPAHSHRASDVLLTPLPQALPRLAGAGCVPPQGEVIHTEGASMGPAADFGSALLPVEGALSPSSKIFKDRPMTLRGTVQGRCRPRRRVGGVERV